MSDFDNWPVSPSPQVMDAINELTVEELSTLHAYFLEETGEFVGVHFIGPDGKICKWADSRRARILQVMDDQIRKELGNTPCQMTM